MYSSANSSSDQVRSLNSGALLILLQRYQDSIASVHQWMKRIPHLKQKTGLLVLHQMLPTPTINQTTPEPRLCQMESPAPYHQMAPPQTVSLLWLAPQ